MCNLPTLGPTTAHGAAIGTHPSLPQGVEVEVGKRAQFIPSDDWPLLVRWWRERVSVNHGGKRRGDQEPRSAFLKRDDAESLTGISQQQVSKWAARLKDEGKYRATLFGAANQEALGFRQRTARLLEVESRSTGRSKQEVARDVLHQIAVKEIHAAKLLAALAPAEANSGDTRGRAR